jgi:photosystem II stability/assembly factor-like uncharacterized protein
MLTHMGFSIACLLRVNRRAGGTVLRTNDAGNSWQDLSISDASSLDFRDIHASDTDTAVVSTTLSGTCMALE